MTERKKKAMDWTMRSFGLVLAGFVNTLGVGFFLVPNSFIDGGFSGVSFLSSHFSGLPIGMFIAILNLPFFLFGWKKMGTKFVISSIIGILSYSLFMFIFKNPPTIVKSDQLILPAVFGGLLSGIGSGLTIRFGGSLDGVDVVSVYLSKKTGISVGKIVLFFNIIILVVAGFVFNWDNALFSIIAYSIGVVAIDFVVTGFDKANAVTIITDRGGDVAKAISDAFGRGVTIISGQGYYSRAEKSMLYCVVNRFEITALKSIVMKADNKAFITISEVAEVLGSAIKLNMENLRKVKQDSKINRIGVNVTESFSTQVLFQYIEVKPKAECELTLSNLKMHLWNDLFQNPEVEMISEPILVGEDGVKLYRHSEDNITFPIVDALSFYYSLAANGEELKTFAVAERERDGNRLTVDTEMEISGVPCRVELVFDAV